jgi:hypothetical protein
MLIGALLGALLPMLLGALLGALMLWRLFRRRQRLLEERCKAEKEQRAMQEMMKAIVLQARARSWLAKRTLQQARADKEAREAAATRVQALMREAARLEQATHETSRRSHDSSSDLRTDVRSRARMPPMQGGVPPLRMSRLDVPPARTDVPLAAASASASARSGWSGIGWMSARAQPQVLPITQPESAFFAADDERTDWPTSSGRHTYARRALQMADGSPASLRNLSPPALLPPPPPPPPAASALLDLEAQNPSCDLAMRSARAKPAFHSSRLARGWHDVPAFHSSPSPTATSPSSSPSSSSSPSPRFRPWLDPATRHLHV